MSIVDNAALQTFSLPGLVHQTVGGPKQGITNMQVWMQTLAPPAAPPVHRHASEEVIVMLKGSGRLTIEGESSDFGPNSTLIIASDVVHQVVNTGDEPMMLIASLAPTPVVVTTPDGQPIPLPWLVP